MSQQIFRRIKIDLGFDAKVHKIQSVCSFDNSKKFHSNSSAMPLLIVFRTINPVSVHSVDVVGFFGPQQFCL